MVGIAAAVVEGAAVEVEVGVEGEEVEVLDLEEMEDLVEELMVLEEVVVEEVVE